MSTTESRFPGSEPITYGVWWSRRPDPSVIRVHHELHLADCRVLDLPYGAQFSGRTLGVMLSCVVRSAELRHDAKGPYWFVVLDEYKEALR